MSVYVQDKWPGFSSEVSPLFELKCKLAIGKLHLLLICYSIEYAHEVCSMHCKVWSMYYGNMQV